MAKKNKAKATLTKKTSTIVRLDMSLKQAHVVSKILGSIAGAGKGRDLMNEVWHALDSAGIDGSLASAALDYMSCLVDEPRH